MEQKIKEALVVVTERGQISLELFDGDDRWMVPLLTTEEGCWLWPGPVKDGYPTQRGVMLHRLLMTPSHRALAREETVDHACHNWALERATCLGGTYCLHRRCLRHLEVVDLRENLRRRDTAHRDHYRYHRDSTPLDLVAVPWHEDEPA